MSTQRRKISVGQAIHREQMVLESMMRVMDQHNSNSNRNMYAYTPEDAEQVATELVKGKRGHPSKLLKFTKYLAIILASAAAGGVVVTQVPALATQMEGFVTAVSSVYHSLPATAKGLKTSMGKALGKLLSVMSAPVVEKQSPIVATYVPPASVMQSKPNNAPTVNGTEMKSQDVTWMQGLAHILAASLTRYVRFKKDRNKSSKELAAFAKTVAGKTEPIAADVVEGAKATAGVAWPHIRKSAIYAASTASRAGKAAYPHVIRGLRSGGQLVLDKGSRIASDVAHAFAVSSATQHIGSKISSAPRSKQNAYNTAAKFANAHGYLANKSPAQKNNAIRETAMALQFAGEEPGIASQRYAAYTQGLNHLKGTRYYANLKNNHIKKDAVVRGLVDQMKLV